MITLFYSYVNFFINKFFPKNISPFSRSFLARELLLASEANTLAASRTLASARSSECGGGVSQPVVANGERFPLRCICEIDAFGIEDLFILYRVLLFFFDSEVFFQSERQWMFFRLLYPISELSLSRLRAFLIISLCSKRKYRSAAAWGALSYNNIETIFYFFAGRHGGVFFAMTMTYLFYIGFF